jgi:hypothetical protein
MNQLLSQKPQLEPARSGSLAGAGAVVFLLLLGPSGCDEQYGCADLCAKEHDCRQDTGVIPTDEAACVDQCERLSDDDPAYADAIAERAACYQDSDTTCEAIAFGFACTVSGE